MQDKQGVPLVEMNLADFTRPISTAMTTQFLTCTAAARVMLRQSSGVILSLTATPGGIGYPLVGGFGLCPNPWVAKAALGSLSTAPS